MRVSSIVNFIAPEDTEPDERRFAGAARLYGAPAMDRLRHARVAVVGVGGVGSWTAEAMARCGVGHLTLIDLDHIAPGNTNRQIHALGCEFGRAKVVAMSERLRAINPELDVAAVEEFVDPDNVATLLSGFDAVLDCIDQASAKAALIAHCKRIGQPVITAGAAGGRRDPTRIRRGDLAHVRGDPLLASVRHRLRRVFGFPSAASPGPPAFDVCAIYVEVDGAPLDGGTGGGAQGQGTPLSCDGYGSSVVVTAPLGFTVAAACIELLTGR
jgi:tRNA A37 threonylcarbamoyladenosine dehydratase